MEKDCFSQEFVDAKKFRDCASCYLFDECNRSVTLKEARTATAVGQGLGFLVAAIGLAVAALNWADMPNGAPWLILASLLYALAINRSGKDFSAQNAEDRERVGREADAKPEIGPVSAAHH